MAPVKTLGILTGGGDVPGLNPCIKAVVDRAIDDGMEVIGFRRGWAGPLNVNPEDPSEDWRWVMRLNKAVVRKIDRSGGTFLHTSRTRPSHVKPKEVPAFLQGSVQDARIPDGHDRPDAARSARDPALQDRRSGCDRRRRHPELRRSPAPGGFPVVAIPKTMDNDVYGTDYCIGFSTAVTRSVDLITGLRTPRRLARAHCGGRAVRPQFRRDLALRGVPRGRGPRHHLRNAVRHGPAGAFLLDDKRANPSNYAIMTISEGATLIGGDIIETGEADAYGHRKLGGIGQLTSDMIKKITGENTIYQQLGYLMRSGAPDSLDRMVAFSYANLATDLIAKAVRAAWSRCATASTRTSRSARSSRASSGWTWTSCTTSERYRPKVASMLGKPMFLY
jgi:ATP-dependent phosphofructokinase / diphosphate-dependent phosphofructokinase